MTTRSGPTVRRRRLGAELRVLRDSAGVRPEEAAAVLECSVSKISRIELGRVSVRTKDLRALLDRYGVTDKAQRDALFALARQSSQPGWWHAFGDAVPRWFEIYIGLEADAAYISKYDHQLVPGLLQTAEYAREIIRVHQPTISEDDLDAKVALRMERQKRLTESDPPHLMVVLDEAVLRRPVGGAETMSAQLAHLIEANRLPTVTVQVLPYSAGAHPAMGSAFMILGFPDASDHEVVYIEELRSSLYIEDPTDVREYQRHLNQIRSISLDVPTSVRMIERAMEDLT
ncbi:helix-turn-helix transcriptional regulator [Frankia sp. CiP3]|uniref:helix-turn-helix domain-containing protein n=1 Tax=Frankia sp. CiP3 TaxID=2880971 RepID=UPI001EF74050|nr:helix-turn-helix transcriptional regulator [Frankia sp. CiP3]